MKIERLRPRLLEKVWGSTKLEPWFESTGAKIGEIWFEGTETLPILVKFIFTTEKLSVQVHPDDDYAAHHHNSRGKTEMWHVLAAEPGARIVAGFRETVSLERLQAAALSGEIEDLLEEHPVEPGDTFFLPAGTVHTIGAGLVLCEIQQHSDITYRLYDYGRPRELHLDHALAVTKCEPHPVRQAPQGDQLVSCRHFTVIRRQTREVSQLAPHPEGFELLIVTEGQGRIGEDPVRSGEVWYSPPRTHPLELTGNFTLLTATTEPRTSFSGHSDQ
jgi:mannose-6-phosphate isomerase